MAEITVRTLCVLLALTMALAARAPLVAADYVFENVNVIPMDEEIVLRDKAVAVKNGEIIAIVDQVAAVSFVAEKRIDGRGRFLMPGLADMHVHVRWDPQAMFKLFIASGVTTVANMRIGDGNGEFDHLKLKVDLAAGEIVGPRYIVSGPQLDNTVLPSVEAVEPALEDHMKQGFDVVKIHDDLAPDVYDALITGVRARNLRVTGHAQHMMPLSKTLEMNSLEHMEEFLYVARDADFGAAAAENFLEAYRDNAEQLWNPDVRALIVRDVADSDMYVDPTLIVYSMVAQWASDDSLAAMKDDENLQYLPRDVREHWLSPETNPYQEEGFPVTPEEVERNVEILGILMHELHDAGVPLLSGSDLFGTLLPGFSLHQELALMVDAGLTPYEALHASTVNVAAYLGEADIAGAIRPAYRADFILLDRNPLADISHARSVSGVFTQGRWYSQSDLQAFLDDVRED